MRGAQVGKVSTPTASVLQGLQKTVEANRVDDVVMLLFEEMQTAKNNGHTMPLSVVFVERKVAPPPPSPPLRTHTPRPPLPPTTRCSGSCLAPVLVVAPSPAGFASERPQRQSGCTVCTAP